MKPRTTHSTGSIRSLRTAIARPRTSSGTPSVAETKWLATMWPVRANQNADSPVSTFPLSGIGVGCTTSYVEIRSEATMRMRSPRSYISRTLPLASSGRSATVGTRCTVAAAAVVPGRRARRSGDGVEAPDDLRGEARVGAQVEDRVEVEPEAAALEQRAQRRAGVPRPLGVLLHDAVRLVAPHPRLDEREQRPLREQRAVRELEVRAHAVGVHHEPPDDAQREVLHVVEQDRRVGQDHPLGARVRDVALVPQGDVLDAGLRVAAQDAGQAADPLADDRVALVGHRARALLLPGPERLLGLADLGALEVADLRGQALEAGPGQRDGLQQRGMAVAGDDLGGHRLAREAEAGEDAGLESPGGGPVRPPP